jgi:hypothetical protein
MRNNATSAAVAQLRPSRPADEETPVVMLTVRQLRELMHGAALAALEEHRAGERPEQATLSGADLAPRLGVSRTRVHHLRQAGMPAIKVGEVYRYELAACLAWLRERGGAGAGRA